MRVDPIAAKDALNMLLSTEALLLAGSTLAASIGHNPPPGTNVTNTPRHVALGIASLMVVVSGGGVAAWIDLYFVEDAFDNVASYVVAIVFLIILVTIPAIGFLAAKWSKPV